MDIINLVKNAQAKIYAFENHPAKKLSLEDKINYLNGLAILINVDDNIAVDEVEYLGTLIHTFDLPTEKLDDFVKFALNPTEDAIQCMVDCITTNEIKYVFLIDCLILSYKDGIIRDKEKELLDLYFKLFKIKQWIQDRIYYVHSLIKDQEDKWQFEHMREVATMLK